MSLKELEFIYVNKTAKLLEASVVCGAVTGGGNKMEVERLRNYARRLGLAFQILDASIESQSRRRNWERQPGKIWKVTRQLIPSSWALKKLESLQGS